MSPLATVETDRSVPEFIASIRNKNKREDSEKLIQIIREITGKEPKIWGDNFIIGFGKYTYRRKGGQEELEWFNVGFAPRKKNITLYVTFDISEEEALLDRLGKCRWGKGCLYINKLEDIDLEVLKKIIEKSKDSTWF